MKSQSFASQEVGSWLVAAHQKLTVPIVPSSFWSSRSDDLQEVESVIRSVVAEVVVYFKTWKQALKAVLVPSCYQIKIRKRSLNRKEFSIVFVTIIAYSINKVYNHTLNVLFSYIIYKCEIFVLFRNWSSKIYYLVPLLKPFQQCLRAKKNAKRWIWYTDHFFSFNEPRNPSILKSSVRDANLILNNY